MRKRTKKELKAIHAKSKYVITAINEKNERVSISKDMNKNEALKFKKQTIESLDKFGNNALLKKPKIKKVE